MCSFHLFQQSILDVNQRRPGSQTDHRALDETIAPGDSDTNSDGDFATEAIPTSLGRYQIKKLLGRGGMGAVYLAHDSQLDRDVALKVPKFEADTNPTLVSRFYREARSAANLSHPNLCQVFDVGEIDGTHYIAMAFIKGRPLSSYVDADNPSQPRGIAAIVRKVAMGMEDAHQSGIIHRDIKPANIMIDHRKEPIVMDFGLAVPQDLGDESRLTQDGALLGSPAYMSPEQLKGQPDAIGAASDIYSLGVVLYELLAGRLPFAGAGSTIAMIGQILTEEPVPLRSVREDIDESLASICHRAMSKEPESRFASMKDFADALTEYLQTGGGRQPAASPAKTAANTTKKTATVTVSQVQLNEQSKLAKTLCDSGQFAAVVPILKQIIANPEAKETKVLQWAQTMLPKIEAQMAQQGKRTTAPGTAKKTVAQSSQPAGDNLFADLPSVPAATTPGAGATPYRRPVHGNKKTKQPVSNKVVGAIAAALVLLVVGGVVAYVVLFSSQGSQTSSTAEQIAASPSNADTSTVQTAAADTSSIDTSDSTARDRSQRPLRKESRDPVFAGTLRGLFDRDRDGYLDRTEIPPPIADQLMAVDVNNDALLSAKELATLNRDDFPDNLEQMPLPPSNRSPHMDDLRDLDSDGDGKITLSEVPVLRRKFLQRADTNNDGVLDRNEIDNIRGRGRPGFGPGRGGPDGRFDGRGPEGRGQGPGGGRWEERPYRPGGPGGKRRPDQPRQ